VTDSTIVLDAANPIPFRAFHNGDGTYSLALCDPQRVQTRTVEMTTGDGFEAWQVFDLGGATVYYVRITVLDFDADGEPIGAGDGEVGADFGMLHSRDGIVWTTGNEWAYVQRVASGVVGDYLDAFGHTTRYIKVGLFVGVVGDTYAGVNHPSAHVQVDLEYRR